MAVQRLMSGENDAWKGLLGQWEGEEDGMAEEQWPFNGECQVRHCQVIKYIQSPHAATHSCTDSPALTWNDQNDYKGRQEK